MVSHCISVSVKEACLREVGLVRILITHSKGCVASLTFTPSEGEAVLVPVSHCKRGVDSLPVSHNEGGVTPQHC